MKSSQQSKLVAPLENFWTTLNQTNKPAQRAIIKAENL
jgi:hypothetical protein